MTAGRDDELARLRAENTRLVELLEAHGIAWRQPEAEQLVGATLSTDVFQVQNLKWIERRRVAADAQDASRA